jgi:MFS family permease
MTAPQLTRSLPFLALLNVATLSHTYWSNVHNPALTQYRLAQLAPLEVNNSLLGVFGACGLLVATLAQPIIGALSDRTQSPFGRRAPYLLIGAVGVTSMAIAIRYAPTLPLLFVAVLFNQWFSNTIHASYHALIPDYVPDRQKGVSSGIKAVLELIAVILGGVAVNQFLAKEQLSELILATAIIVIGSVLVTVSLLVRTPIDPPPPTANTQSRKLSISPALRYWVINRYLFWVALIGFRQFMVGYLRDVWGLSNSAALALVGEFIILLGIGVLLSVIPAGWLSDRIGRRPLITLAGLAAAVGVFGVLSIREVTLLRIIAVGVGAGAGMYFSANWALITTLVPPREAALYLGIANIATTFGSATGQLSGLLIDAVNRGGGDGYTVVFGLAGLFFVLSGAAIWGIQEPARFTD